MKLLQHNIDYVAWWDVMKYKWNEFGKINTSEKLSEYLVGRELTHTAYCHYTSLDVINSILENNSLRISNVGGFNDQKEKEQFPNLKYFFAICFATGVNENLPLWYLYSGLSGQGGRLNFTKGQFKKIINTATYELQEIDKKSKKAIGESIPLQINEQVKICVKDIIYYKDGNPNVSLKYNTMTNYVISKDEFDTYRKDNIGFVKPLIWFYEKETRIIAELVGTAKELIDDDKTYCIKMSIDKCIMSKVKINLAPEITNKNFNDILSGKDYILKHIAKTSKVQLSTHSGEVEMNLCAKCNK